MSKQAARDEVHVAVAQAAEMSRAKMRTVMSAEAVQLAVQEHVTGVREQEEPNEVAGNCLACLHGPHDEIGVVFGKS